MSPRFEVGRATLTAKGRRWHATGHPWAWRDDISAVEEGRGFLVRVRDDRGDELGVATWSPSSKIALRFVGAGQDEAEDPLGDRLAWFRARLQRAIERRAVLAAETDACRLVSAEADGLPGLIVDCYAKTVVLQSLTPFIEEHLDHIVPALVDLVGASSVIARNDVRVRRLEGLAEGVELCHGSCPDRVDIVEHGLRLSVDPWRGQKTGFFLDQRPARARAEALAAESQGPVLDLFCYTGGFALHAARGGGGEVMAVDSSGTAVSELAAAAERNGLANVEAVQGKVARVLRQLEREGRRFAGIVLDPPAFAKSRADVDAAHRGYVDLNARAMGLLQPGGWMLTCSCSFNMRAERFREVLREAAARAGRRVFDRGRLAPAIDHPVLLGLPESDYLKMHLLRMAD
ncbi:MAG: class I SAM-dependent rRNA methyltransferase [Planctomycetota bacterium]|nr:class I SAM-dependent rRNA methyltransferase [Planctomycetota bacterium]